MATLGRLMSLLSPFDVVIWMTDGWPLYESRLKGKLHVISKRYTQRIERHNPDLGRRTAQLGQGTLWRSQSLGLRITVLAHYISTKHSLYDGVSLPSYAISEKSHGREETRLHIVCDVPDELIDFTFE